MEVARKPPDTALACSVPLRYVSIWRMYGKNNPILYSAKLSQVFEVVPSGPTGEAAGVSPAGTQIGLKPPGYHTRHALVSARLKAYVIQGLRPSLERNRASQPAAAQSPLTSWIFNKQQWPFRLKSVNALAPETNRVTEKIDALLTCQGLAGGLMPEMHRNPLGPHRSASVVEPFL
jgi:hypothetical protein